MGRSRAANPSRKKATNARKAARRNLPEPEPAHRNRVSVTRRLVVADVSPQIENGRYPIRRVVGDIVPVQATVLCDGAVSLRACILYRPAGDNRWRPAPMQPLHENQAETQASQPAVRRWQASELPAVWQGHLRLQQGGILQFCIEAWVDVFATWMTAVQALPEATLPEAALLERGERILDDAMSRATGADLRLLAGCRDTLRADAQEPGRWQRWLQQRDLHKRMLVHGERRHVVRTEPVLEIEALRRRAAFVCTARLTPPQASERGVDAGALRGIGAEMVVDATPQGTLELPPGVDRLRTLAWPRLEAGAADGADDGVDVDFWSDDRDAVWDACLATAIDTVRHGAQVLCVPRATELPYPFWEWLIRRVRQVHPEALFAHGAATPLQARALSRVGFSMQHQTWTDDLEAACGAVRVRATQGEVEWHDWIEVPSGDTSPSAERRLVQLLAALSSASYGVDHVPSSPEALAWLRQLQQWRRENRALQISGNLQLLPTTTSNLLAFHRGLEGGSNELVVVVSALPRQVLEGEVQLPELPTAEAPAGDWEDLVDGQRYTWQTGPNFVRLGPERPVHVLRRARVSRLFD